MNSAGFNLPKGDNHKEETKKHKWGELLSLLKCIIISTVSQPISISKMPYDELQGEEENIMKMFHEMRKLENGSGALELGSRDSSPSRTTLRLATNNLKHTPYNL